VLAGSVPKNLPKNQINGRAKLPVKGHALAILYLWFGRQNILPLIFSHGAINSLGMTSRFLGIRGDQNEFRRVMPYVQFH